MPKHRVKEVTGPVVESRGPGRLEADKVTRPSMRFRIAIIVLACAVVAAAIVAATVGSGIAVKRGSTGIAHSWNPSPTWNPRGHYKLTFDDEFNGTELNSANWTSGWFGTGNTSPVENNDYAANSSGNVSVSNGSLNLRLTKQSIRVGGKTYPYTGALVSSNGNFSFAYGSIEFRAYVPADAQGNVADWPALWTDGQNWPVDGENDIFEAINGYAAYHFHSGPAGSDGLPNNGGNVTAKIAGWHTFGADWQPGKVRYYYDKKLVGTITTGITGAPQYIVMGIGIGPGSRPAVGSSDLRIDWVRVWKES